MSGAHQVSRTNRQVALEAAVKRYEGLHPTGKRSYNPEDLARGPLKLADLFLEWLEGDEPSAPPARGRRTKKDTWPDGAEPIDLLGGS